MDGGGQSTQFSSSAMQRKAIIAKLKASGLAKGKVDDGESSGDEPEYNFEKLKTFHIPRKKDQQHGKDLLTELSMESREFTHTLYPAIKASFFYPHSSRLIKIQKVDLVNNNTLMKEFLEKKKDMKDEGRTEKELSEHYAFLYSTKNQVSKICQNGLQIGNTGLASLGKSNLGVYICKHADVVLPSPLSSADSACILVFKIVKGKTKLVTEFRGKVTNQEPTPLYDCHITKFTNEPSKGNHSRAYQALQYYMYEYGELDLVPRPRQILPYAVLHITCMDNDRIHQQRESYTSMLDSSTVDSDQNKRLAATNRTNDARTFRLWMGKLLVKGGSFCNVEMRTESDVATNKAFLDNSVNVKIFVSLDNFSKQLPPTLLNKSGKKHNVVYRGRNYNIFTLVPADESGFGKFRQLIAHLIQRKAVAVVPLRMASCLYLIPNTNLTVNRMGLLPPAGDREKPNTQFLHVLVVTPKFISTKVNDQKLYNIITVRKRRDPQSETRVPEEVDQKLRLMNIESSSAAGALLPDQYDKLLEALKDKKRQQISDKFLHNHYKEPVNYFSSKDSFTKFTDSLKGLWLNANHSRSDIYKPKESKTPITQPRRSILKSATVERSPQTKISKISHSEISVDVDAEATFSDEDDSDNELKSKTFLSHSKSATAKQQPEETPEVEKRKYPLEIDNKVAPPIKISRPSFKALVEVILTASVHELMLHPDFVFSERFEKTHRVTKSTGFSETFDLDIPDQISVQFRQQVPFDHEKDCPYAHENDPVVKSMLRALYGIWVNQDESVTEEKYKVNWVRDILHKNKQTGFDHAVTSNGRNRTVSDDTTMNAKDQSPSVSGSYSADSGFGSSSTTTTPNAASLPTSSFQDIASLLATALKGKQPDEIENSLLDDNNDPQTTTQNLIQAFVKTVNDSGLNIPIELKTLMDLDASISDKVEDDGDQDLKEPSVEQEVLDTSLSASSCVTSVSEATPGSTSSTAEQQISSYTASSTGFPQDPRLNKVHASHRLLRLPNYHFPPSEKATQLLPKDGEAAQNLSVMTNLKITNPQDSTKTESDPSKTNPTRAGLDQRKSSSLTATILSLPGISIKKKSLMGHGTPPNQTTGVHQQSVTTCPVMGLGTSIESRSPDIDRYRTNFRSAISTKPSTNLTTPSELRTTDAPITLEEGKNTGNNANDGLTSILCQLGIMPLFLQDTQTIQGLSQSHPVPQKHGILRGTPGEGGPTEKNGNLNLATTGQLIRIIDDKRVLVDTKNNDPAPLGSLDKPSEILSNKIPVVISENRISTIETLGNKFTSDNLRVIKLASSEDDRNVIDAQPHSAKSVAGQTKLSSATLDLNDETKLDIEPLRSLSNEATSTTTAVSCTTVSSLCASENSVSLPQSYVQEINEKFRQQRRLRQQQANNQTFINENRSSAVSHKVSQPMTVVQAVSQPHIQSQIAVTKNSTTTISTLTISSPKSTPTPNIMDNSVSQPSQTLQNIPAAQVAPMQASAPGVPSKENLFSEISRVLKDVQQGQSSTEDLSSQLLQLAMQLRSTDNSKVSSLILPDTIAPSTTADKCISPAPPKDDAIYQQTDLSSTTEKCKSDLTVLGTSDNEIANLSPISPSEMSLDNNADSTTEQALDMQRDTHTPILDDSFDPNNDVKVKKSFSNTYYKLQPLSNIAKSRVRMTSRLRKVLEKVDESPSNKQDDNDRLSTSTPSVSSVHSVMDTSNIFNSSLPEFKTEDEVIISPRSKIQKVAHVKPQPPPCSDAPLPSFYVFNPRNDPECMRMCLLLMRTGKQFEMHKIADAVAKLSTSADDVLVPITKELINEAISENVVWIVIRSSDVELIPALPHLSLLKCAGSKVNFIKADSADNILAKKFTNIMAGEFGIILPESVRVLTANHDIFISLLCWMQDLNVEKCNPYWRLALPKHILLQLHVLRDKFDVNEKLKLSVQNLLDMITKHMDVIIEIDVTDDQSEEANSSEIFDAAIGLQKRYVDITRHVVVLTENEVSNQQWNVHRRSGVAVATVQQFVRAIMDKKKENPKSDEIENDYSPLMKIYMIEK